MQNVLDGILEQSYFVSDFENAELHVKNKFDFSFFPFLKKSSKTFP